MGRLQPLALPPKSNAQLRVRAQPGLTHRHRRRGGKLLRSARILCVHRQPSSTDQAELHMVRLKQSAELGYHDRQIVVLPPSAGIDWLRLDRPAAEMLKPSDAGSFQVVKVFP